jgi:Pre-PUA-like domain
LPTGKDVKRLRADAAAACSGLSEAALDELVPLKASVQMQKLANRAVVYSVANGEPLFFEVWCWRARWWVYLA